VPMRQGMRTRTSYVMFLLGISGFPRISTRISIGFYSRHSDFHHTLHNFLIDTYND